MNKLDLSIIIVSYNTLQITLNCINSIIKSIKNIVCEIIIIDNASKDKTIDEIQKLKVKNQNYKLKVKIVQNKNNLGYGKANNQGIELA